MPIRASKHPQDTSRPPPPPYDVCQKACIFDFALIRPRVQGMEVFRLSRSTTLIKSKSNYHLDFMLIKSQSRRGWRTDEPLPYSLYSPPGPSCAIRKLSLSLAKTLRTSVAFAPCPSMRQISPRTERSIADKFLAGKGSGIH